MNILKRLFSHRPQVGLEGWVECRAIDKATGKKTLLWRKHNLILDAGLAQAALLMGSGPANPLATGCVGEGATAPAVGNTALEDQADAQAATFSRITTAVANDTSQWVSTHTAPAGGWALTEYGLKNADNTFFCRVTFAAVNLAEGNQFEFTYTCQMTRVA